VTGIDITGALGICTTGVGSIELEGRVVGTGSPGESAADLGFPSAGVVKVGCGITATGPEACPWNNLPELEEPSSADSVAAFEMVNALGTTTANGPPTKGSDVAGVGVARIAEYPAWGIAGAAGGSEGGTAFPSAGFVVTCAKVGAVEINGAPNSAGTDGMASDGTGNVAVGPASGVGLMAVWISVLVAEAGIS
jgi:hypothetical protein